MPKRIARSLFSLRPGERQPTPFSDQSDSAVHRRKLRCISPTLTPTSCIFIVNYSIALRFFAFMLAVIGVGLVAIVARIACAAAPEPRILRTAARHMPAVSAPRSRARCLVVSLVALAVACGVIVCQ